MVALIGLVGYGMMVMRFEAAPLLLGFVLGPLMEENLRRALLISRGQMSTFIERPISATLLGLSVALIAWSVVSGFRRSARARAEGNAD